MVFEKNIHACSNFKEVRKLLNQKPTHADLYKKSCSINLIKDSFSHLKLKDNYFQIFDVVNDNAVDQICAQINLDKDITGRETVGNLPDHPKLKAFLDYCTMQRTYFCFIKKCGKADCTTCFPLIYHLMFLIVCITYQIRPPILQMKTITNLLVILMTLKQPKLLCRHVMSQRAKGMEYHSVPWFNMPKIQIWKSHAPNLISHELFTPKKVSPSTIRKFKIKISDIWFTCGASIEELVGEEPSFDSLFIRNNLACQTPVETIYCSANYATCCSHCGSTRQL